MAANPTSNVVNAAVVFEPAPGVAKGDAIWAVGATYQDVYLTYRHWRGMTINRVGVHNLLDTANGHCTIDDCNFDNGGGTGALGAAAGSGFYLVGGTVITNWTGGSALGAGTAEIRMLRGVTAGVANTGHNVEARLWLGCALRGVRTAYGTRGTSGCIIAFNQLTRLGNSDGEVIGMTSTGETLTDGFALVQNVIEYTSASANPSAYLSGDNVANDSRHVICWHNTFAGFDVWGRGNILYDDTVGDPRSQKLQSFIGNVHVQINTKHDVFMADGARVGGWGYLYGVGCRGEFSRYRDASGSGFKQDYPGLAASIGTTNTGAGNDPLFTTPAHTTSGPVAGAGGGNYVLQAGSPARGRLSISPVAFDFTGTARSGIVAAGAYV
jgi:hypothetical protein